MHGPGSTSTRAARFSRIASSKRPEVSSMFEHRAIDPCGTRCVDHDGSGSDAPIKLTAAVNATTFRQALGQFPTGVCVLTSVVEGALLGMTVSSFNSLSLNPPLVLFSIDRRAGSLPFWQKAHGYALNVLAESQAEMSTRFAKPCSDKWKGTRYAIGLFGAPLLPGAAPGSSAPPKARASSAIMCCSSAQ